ncbi:MAG: M23 family metallopeptidase [Tannerella sp.]|jgi:murein DD-endopeptidase MepM/ murein hydrolase activator NlpD|nr:M23 family metallopeptidase [Tannerella sp.]
MKTERLHVFTPILAACCLTVAGWWAVSCKTDRQSSEPSAPYDEYASVVDTSAYFLDICVDSLDVSHHTIHSGENLSLIFHRLGLSPSRTDSIIKVAGSLLDPKKIRAGNRYYTLTMRDEEAQPMFVVFAKTLTDHVVIDLSPPVGAYPYQKEVALRQSYLDGSVKSSLWTEIRNRGVDPVLAVHLSDVYAWQIDFFAIQPEDSFQVFYTEAFIDSVTSTGILSVDGALFIQAGRPYLAIPFMQDSVREFFDEEGQSLRKAFLKAPLDFFRITSRFTHSRFHPVLKRYRAHHGVDYAAPTGTPVKTIGDGRVVARGFESGGGGNYLKIQHNATYTTSYMHLSRFAAGTGVGAHVRQGEVIGYVGSTGLSTGAHLDFRVYRNGQAIDPLKMESPPSHPVRPALRDSFERVRLQLTDRLRASGGMCDTATLSVESNNNN